MTSGWRT